MGIEDTFKSTLHIYLFNHVSCYASHNHTKNITLRRPYLKRTLRLSGSSDLPA